LTLAGLHRKRSTKENDESHEAVIQRFDSVVNSSASIQERAREEA